MYTGIHITETCLRIVQAKVTEANTSIVVAAEFELPLSENEKFANDTALKFREFMNANNIKISEAVVGVTGEDVNVRCVKAPGSCPQNRLHEIARMEMEQISDNSSVSLSYDYMLLPEYSDTKEQVLLMVLVRNNFIDRITQFLSKAKIKVTFFVPCALGLYYFFLKHGSITDQTSYIIDLGRYDLNFAIVKQSNLLFMRNLSVKEQNNNKKSEKKNKYELVELDLTQEEEETISAPSPIAQKNIPDLLDASTKFAKIQTGISKIEIERVLIVGEESNDRNLREALLKKMGCPIVPLQLEGISTKELPAKNVTFFQQFSRNFCVAIGVALLHSSKKESPIQVISARKKAMEKLFREKLFECAAVAIALFAITFSALFTFVAKSNYQEILSNMQQRFETYSTRHKNIKETLAKNKELKKRFDFLQQKVYTNKYMLEVLAYINLQVPETMYLETLEFSSHGGTAPSIKIEGAIDESFKDVYSILDEFHKKLKELPIVATIKDKDPQLDEEEGKLSFTLEVFLKVAEDLK